MVEWLAGNRIRGTSTERTSATGFHSAGGGWKFLGRAVAPSSGTSTLSVSGFDDKRYYMILGDIKATGGDTVSHIRVNSDGAGNYALRREKDNVQETPSTSTNRLFSTHNSKTADTRFIQGYISNKSDKEKLGLFNVVENGTDGSTTNDLSRIDGVGKHAPSSLSVLNEIRLFNDEAGSFAEDSELVVLGWDPADTHTDNFWTQLDSFNGTNATTMTGNAFTAKKYLWIQGFLKATSGTITPLLKLGSGGTVDYTATGYSLKYQFNNLSPVAMNNTTAGLGFFYTTNGSADGIFFNTFIVNKSGSDKLCMSHINDGSATPDRTRLTSKWSPTSNPQANIVGVGQWSGSGTFSTDSIIKVWGSD